MLVTTLKGYLAETNLTAKEFSEKVECAPEYISRILRGKTFPGKKLARDIFKETNGIVNLPTNPKTQTYKYQNKQQNKEKPQT